MSGIRRLAAVGFFGGGVVVGAVGCGDYSVREDLGENASALTANDKTAFDYFLGKGLTSTQAAGIVGNLDVESGMDPTAVQSGGPGRGIAQWSAGARWDTTTGDNVKSYASMHGADPLSLGLQLDFIWFELATFPSYGLAKLRAATTVTAAVSAFQTDFEACGACDGSTRVSDAQAALTAYGSDVPSDGGVSVDAAATCVVAATGESGQCLSTAACDALGDHMSTPGLCPGAADIQCCTKTNAEAGTPLANGGDGGGSSSGSANGGGRGGDTGGSGASGGGCSTAGHGNGTNAALVSLLGLVALLARPRRRRRQG